MKKQNILISIFIVFVMGFISLGYASLTKEMNISGELEVVAPPYQGVYITEVELISTSGATSVDFEFIHPTIFKNTVSANQMNSSVTYRVTVHNNTDYTQWYRGTLYMYEEVSNGLINSANGIKILTKDKVTDTTSTFDISHWVPAQQYRSFYVTYNYGTAASGTRTNLINFDFGFRIDRVYDGFLEVLNDKSPGGGYETISGAFNDNYKENHTTTLGNVGDDKEVFDQLFGSNITLEVDGVEKPVTIIIRRENIDNNKTGDEYNSSGAPKGCEYTVYITVDDVSAPGGKVTVYATTYSCGEDGVWKQLGHMYEGTANKKDYDTSTGTYEGGFDVYDWIAKPNVYEVADNVIYKVGQEQGDQYDKLKELEDIIQSKDQDIFNDIDNCKIMKRIYDILKLTANSQAPEVIMLREAFNEANPFFVNHNGGQEFKINRSCIRAEIIPIIEKLQKALDYYNQTK